MKSAYIEAAYRELERRGAPEREWEILALTSERATVGSAVLVVKVDSNPQRLAWEVAVMKRAAAAGVPVPTVLEFRRSPNAVLTIERVAGQALALSSDARAARDTGRVLRRLHAIQPDPPHGGWRDEVLHRGEREMETLIDIGMLDSPTAQRVSERFASIAPLLDRRPVSMLHGDLGPWHVITKAGRVQALIDFADGGSGDCLWDIAVLTSWDDEREGEVLEGYKAEGSMLEAVKVLLPAYRLLRHICAARWEMDEGDESHARRHVEWVRSHTS